CLQSKNLVTF
nr:immunoglobulin light chain junction region [Macaca mulatta]MOW40051.1 immunoglobulin light chain junction region [Macaca mulatta]